MDEKVKHRVVGLAVILSIGAIIAPAVVKKSSQRFDERTATTFHVPQRPTYPKVTVADEKEVFSTVKVAHVELDKPRLTKPKVNQIAKAQPIANLSPPTTPVVLAKKNAIQKQPVKHSRRFSVQLASFTRQKNADALVETLSKKGYKAHFEKVSGKSGRTIFKVVVGDEVKRESALKLRQKLVKSTKLNGIVIAHRVS